MRRNLGEVLDDRANSLTSIRLVLAGLVLVAHAASISGLADHPLVGGVGLGTWALMAFFAISGYLVSQSRARLDLWSFLAHRAARIMPAFWVANIVTAAVAAPIAAHLAGAPVDLASAMMYPLRNAFLVMEQWTIAGTLDDAPYTEVWNGSLWTLAQEGGWYVLTGLVFLWGVWRRNLVAASGLLLFTMTALNSVTASWATLGAFFAAGMVLYSLKDRLMVTWPLVAIAGSLLIVAGATRQVVLIAPLPLAYLVLAASGISLPGLRASTDLSYGVYVYAFPVSQLLAQAEVQRAGLFIFTMSSAAATAVLAWLSWKLVEWPAITAIRTRFPRGRVPPGVVSGPLSASIGSRRHEP